MEKAQAYIRIQELRDIINEANRKYYVENSPTLRDYEFDMLLKELEALEKEHPELVTPDSPTQKVGSDLKTSGKPHSLNTADNFLRPETKWLIPPLSVTEKLSF